MRCMRWIQNFSFREKVEETWWTSSTWTEAIWNWIIQQYSNGILNQENLSGLDESGKIFKRNKIYFFSGFAGYLAKWQSSRWKKSSNQHSFKSLFHYSTNSHAKLRRAAHIKPSTLNFAARLCAPKQSLLSAVSEPLAFVHVRPLNRAVFP